MVMSYWGQEAEDQEWAPVGTKVIFDRPNNGYESQQEKNESLGLVVGGVYTVASSEMSSSYSSIKLEEFPGHTFNSVFFSTHQMVDNRNKAAEYEAKRQKVISLMKPSWKVNVQIPIGATDMEAAKIWRDAREDFIKTAINIMEG